MINPAYTQFFLSDAHNYFGEWGGCQKPESLLDLQLLLSLNENKWTDTSPSISFNYHTRFFQLLHKIVESTICDSKFTNSQLRTEPSFVYF